MDLPLEQGLYDPANEHDACGVGFIAHIKGNKTHEIVLQGLEILKNLDHRGAVGADPLQGDGAGILIQIPDTLFREEMAKQGVTLPPAGDYGVGMVFLPKEHASVSPARKRSSAPPVPKARSCSAGATCPPTRRCPCRRPSRPRSR
jgi:glutamate synthase (NADPH/NADH) large chain